MTANMARLQQKIEQNDLIGVKLISFSIDPETDTPERLTKFADKYQADYSNWSFLTDYSFEEIKRFSIKSFKNLIDTTTSSDELIHGTSFY